MYLETPQVLAKDLLESIIIVEDQYKQIDTLLVEFNQLFIFIYLEYSIYKQFNQFIWTVVILQFIFIRNKQYTQSAKLSTIIEKVLEESCGDQLILFIQCFDLINNLYQKSVSKNDLDDILLTNQTEKINRIDSYNLTEEKELKEFDTKANADKVSDRFFILEDQTNQSLINITNNAKMQMTHVTDSADNEIKCSLKINESLAFSMSASNCSCKSTNSGLEFEIDQTNHSLKYRRLSVRKVILQKKAQKLQMQKDFHKKRRVSSTNGDDYKSISLVHSDQVFNCRKMPKNRK